jgi:hypothetical protein
MTEKIDDCQQCFDCQYLLWVNYKYRTLDEQGGFVCRYLTETKEYGNVFQAIGIKNPNGNCRDYERKFTLKDAGH